MFGAEFIPLAEVKNRLSEVVSDVEKTHARVVVTRHGRPAAVLMSVDDLESLEETLEIMSDPKAMREIRAGQRELAQGKTKRLTKEEVLALARRRR